MKRVLLQAAFVLHRRPYRETGFLIELFTFDYGRITVAVHGARKVHSSRPGLLQPFVPLLISCSGKYDLMTLTHVELHSGICKLTGRSLFAGFYLNELLIHLLQKWDAHPDLYICYEKTIIGLEAKDWPQKILRSFEKHLLEEVGYALLSKDDPTLPNTVKADKYYRFVPEQGFVSSDLCRIDSQVSAIFSGKSLLAIAREDWSDEVYLEDAKRLIRLILAYLFGSRQLQSRRLFFF